MLGLGLGVNRPVKGFGRFEYLSELPSFVPSEYSLAFDASGAETLADYEAGTLYFRDSNFNRVGATFSRTTTATRVNRNGLIETVAANVPRIDYSDGSAKLLMEPSRSNLLLRSEEFDDASWVKVSATINANNVVAPDGTLTADTINVSVQDVERVIQRVLVGTSIAGITYTGSIWLKGQGSNIGKLVRFRIKRNSGGVSSDVVVNHTLTSNWVRISATFTGLTDNTGIAFGFDGAANYADSFDVWGAQLEAGSYPTSYIPTAGSTVTRNADGINSTSLGLTDCTFFINYVPRSITSGLLDFYNAANARQFYIAFSPTGYVTFGSVVGGTIGNVVGPLNVNEPIKLAFKLNSSTGDLTIYVNGINEGTFATTISDINKFLQTASFGYVQNTLYDDIIIFPTQLTDTELAQLTS